MSIPDQSDKLLAKPASLRANSGRYVVIVLVVIVVVCMGYLISRSQVPPPTVELKDLPVETALQASIPTYLRIPKISLSTSFEAPLGVNPDGTIGVPVGYDKVGWYTYSPTPGEVGPAVILGHVSSVHGPAVFYDLQKLAIGDEIYIDREDGTIATFVVTATEEPSQDVFPTDKVYGNIDHAGLRLITCAGTYDQGTDRFTHNLIVYAQLKEV